ncbi:MAG: hypothetical protein JW915_23925 [Chitinispirillaceae bacterium]|nr:hypothetical protein [Chitinispirillaceae bacterium]
MRKAIETVIINLFNLLPQRLSVRSFFIFWLTLPYIVIKFSKRSLNRRRSIIWHGVTAEKAEYSTVSTAKSSFQILADSCSDEEICIRYSGGTDSTLTAAYMASRYRRVHLLTFASSYENLTFGMIRSSPRSTCVNVGFLQKRFGKDRFVHTIVSLETIRNEIYFGLYQKFITHNDFLRVSLCPACTVAMHKLTIEYCKKHYIRFVSDGSSEESGSYPWQMQYRENLDVIIRKYKKAGISYCINPCYKVRESAQLLFENGILPEMVDRKSFRYRRKTQQFCIPIQMQSLCRNLHGKVFPADAERVTQFVDAAL